MKKIPNIVKSAILCIAIIFVVGKILAFIYPASDPNSKECPDIFIMLLLLFAPLISGWIFPSKIKNKAIWVLAVICKGTWVVLWLIGILMESVDFLLKGNNSIISLIFLIILSIILIYIGRKNKKSSRSTGSSRNPSILPAPPMQSPPPPPQPRRYSLARVDAMEGHEFEHFTADLLRKLGYQRVQVTPGSGDQGVDVLAEKDGIKYAFQCKCYSSDLGNKPVQEVHAGKYIGFTEK